MNQNLVLENPSEQASLQGFNQNRNVENLNNNNNNNTILNTHNLNFIQQQQVPQQQTIVHVRDRLFHALFYRIAILYARKFSKTFRRLIEFFLLILALGSFGLLSYLHVVFNRNPINCLSFIQEKWPRDGILRIEIVHNATNLYIMSYDEEFNSPSGYSLKDSYEKEYSNTVLDLFSSYLSSNENDQLKETSFSKNNSKSAKKIQKKQLKSDRIQFNPFYPYLKLNNNLNLCYKNSENANQMQTLINSSYKKTVKQESPKTTEEIISPAFKFLKEAFSELQLFSKVFEDNYVIEYSLEYGFLRLSPQTRKKLNITVMLVTLDPSRDECFGTGFNKFVLDEFLGYNEILMLSIKSIAEKEKNKGFVRNAVTGEHFRFVSSWMARSSYVAALLIMILFVSLNFK